MADTPISFAERKGVLVRKPFVPLTGNPENGDYLDFYREMEAEGELVQFPAQQKADPQKAP